ncbi:MAG: ribosome biogenesis GTP-binding protein YihA/YsxC [bacterium]|nr:ribosome biogenesis GTP-binding protein YihA/YsxC [bacterium]
MHLSARFIAGAPHVDQLPPSSLFEVAFIGRSNVGKSTLINKVTNQKGLARSSNTPGRTREVNLFAVSLSNGGKVKYEFLLSDLPGFGFSKLPKEKQHELHVLILDYIENRENLKAVFLLNDIRRDPQIEELEIRERISDKALPVYIVLTKTDKLTANDKAKRIQIISKAFSIEPKELIVVGSDISGAGIRELILNNLKAL